MTTDIKICGLNTAAAMDAALDAGADYVGLVFFARSPRNVALADAVTLAARARDRADVVALTVDAHDAVLDAIMRELRPDWLQMHGSESVERIAGVKARTGCGIIKAVKVASAADVLAGLAFAGVADLLLFDAKAPPSLANALPGGNGLSFDWSLLDTVRPRGGYMLSGGLDPANVAAAIIATGAGAVDVSSGVESAPGVKDAYLIRQFIAAARAVDPAS